MKTPYRILGTVPKAEPGSDEYAALTKAAAQWRHWGATDPQGDMVLAENVARELEIQRDSGNLVAINPRC